MKCGLCGEENKTGSRFCIRCGAPLQPLAEQFEEVRQELDRLGKVVASLDSRLAAIETVQGVARPAEPPVTSETKATVGPAEEPISPSPATPGYVPPDVGEPVSGLPVETPGLAASETARPISSPPSTRVPAEAKPAKPREWEQVLGGNWLARIGVIALILGVGFFLKFAYDNRWPGPFVIAGVVVGLVMAGAGYYWRKRYPVFAQAISGGGIAILYLSVFAAFMTFQLIGALPALLLVLMISVGSAALATRYNSMALAILGIVGAFIAPVLLGVEAPNNDRATAATYGAQLLPYVLVVDMGVLVLSAFRNWRWFTFLSLAGSLIFFVEWYGLAGDRLSLLAAEGGLTLIFLIFVAATTFFHIIRTRPVSGADYALAAINAAAYFILSEAIMWTDLRAWLGGFSLVLALFYGCLAYAAFRRNSDKTLAFFTLGISIVIVTIAIPEQLRDVTWDTIAWAAQAAVLFWLSLRTRITHFRVYAYIAFVLVGIRLVFFDSWVAARIPVFNTRVLAFVLSSAALYVSGYLVYRRRVEHWRAIHNVFVVAGNFSLLWMIGVELGNYSALQRPTAGNSLDLLVLLVIAVAMTVQYALWKRTTSVIDIVSIMINAVALAGLSAFLWGHLRVWMGAIYLVLAASHGALVCFLFRRGEKSAPFAHFALAISVGFLTLSVPVEFRNQVWTTIGWALEAVALIWLAKKIHIADFRIYSGISIALFTVAVPVHFGNEIWTTIVWALELVALMWLSFALAFPELRSYSYAVFVGMAAQLIVFRTGVDVGKYRPLFNERFLVYLAGIAASYLAVYLLSRNRAAFSEWAIPASTLLIGANLLTLWLLSFEVWGYFGSRQSANLLGQGRSAQYLSLTALWALYAMVLIVIGIARRWRSVRLAGLGLLAVPIVKVFVFDVWVLDMVYRIAAFVGLGLLLLIGAYLYQRYGKAIRVFILSK